MENLPTEQQQDEVKKVIWVAVKEVARKVIGQPKPTQVRSGRRGRKSDGRHRAGVSGGLDIYEENHEETEVLDAPRLATNPLLHGAAVTGIPSRYFKDVRPRWHETSTVFHFSQEVIGHANFLRETQGQGAMETYLKQIKENSMDHGELAEKSREITDARKEQSVPGGIEAQMNDALRKAKHYREEAGRLEKEADQQDRIALKLQEVLDIMGGQTDKEKGSSGTRLPHGEWDRRWKECASLPIRRNELIQLVVKRYEIKPPSAYGALNKAIEKGSLVRLPDNMVQYAEEKVVVAAAE